MRNYFIGEDPAPAAKTPFDWGALANTIVTTIPTLFNHGSSQNKYGYSAPVITPQSNIPVNPAQSDAQTYTAKPSTGLSTTSILLLAGAGLVAFKMLKKK